jgi:hypothetical protein
MVADVIQFRPTPKQTDGGKARIRRKGANYKFRLNDGTRDMCDDLVMDHADPIDYMPSEYCAPVVDPA